MLTRFNLWKATRNPLTPGHAFNLLSQEPDRKRVLCVVGKLKPLCSYPNYAGYGHWMTVENMHRFGLKHVPALAKGNTREIAFWKQEELKGIWEGEKDYKSEKSETIQVLFNENRLLNSPLTEPHEPVWCSSWIHKITRIDLLNNYPSNRIVMLGQFQVYGENIQVTRLKEIKLETPKQLNTMRQHYGELFVIQLLIATLLVMVVWAYSNDMFSIVQKKFKTKH
jgi:hypothetical protein